MTSSDTVERVRDAIYRHSPNGGFLDASDADDAARAAIAEHLKAIREPGEALIVEGFLASQCKYADLSNNQLRAGWQAMIDQLIADNEAG